MRDIERIDRILSMIKEVWNENPDSRFGQLLINCGILKDSIEDWSMEDDYLESNLRLRIKLNKKKIKEG